MKKKFLYGTLAVGMLCTPIFTSCKADVDLNNISPEIQMGMGLALPVGEASATIGDFIGDSAIAKYIHVQDDGVLFYEDNFFVSRNFHNIDLAQYISNTKKDFAITDKMSAGTTITGDGTTTQQMEFAIGIKLTGINNDLSYERLDSVWITNAAFTSTFNVKDFDLSYGEVEKLEMILPEENFHSRNGQSNIIEIPLGQAFGQAHLIQFSDFTLNLIKDKNLHPTTIAQANNNVVDSVTVKFRFTIKIANGKTVTVQNSSAFNYNFQIQFLDYDVIWGYFTPSNLVKDEDTIVIANEWDAWKFIQKMSLPIAKPSVTVQASTQVGAPLSIMLYYLATISDNGETKYASFENSNRYLWSFPNFIDPTTDAPGTIVTNQKTFDNTESNGRIDQLLAIKPDKIVYSYETMINSAYPNVIQHRMTKNTQLDLNIDVRLPFIFNKGVDLAYSDTIKNVNLSAYTLDSLLTDVNVIDTVKTSDLKLIILAENTIPFDITGTFQFLDSLDNEIDVNVLKDNILKIAGAKNIEREVVMSAEQSSIVISLTRDTFDKVAKIKKIAYTAVIDGNTATVSLLDKTSLKIKVALSAKVDAIINLDNKNNKK